MERAGWKGRAGSALACHAETEKLFRDVMRAGWERGRLGRATLTAVGRPLAMSSWFVTGDRGFGFKMRSEEHTSELQSLMRISYAVFCLKKKKKTTNETVTQ